MTTFIPIPNGIEVSVHATQFGSERINIHGVKSSGTHPTLIELQNAADAVHAAYSANVGIFNANVIFSQIIARDISQVGGSEFTLGASDIVPGNTHEPLPGNVTFAVKRATGLSGRNNRGRIYMFGLTVDNMDSAEYDKVNTIYANGVITLLTDIQANLTAATLTYALASRSQALMVPYTTFIATDLYTDSMRRRLVGRGR